MSLLKKTDYSAKISGIERKVPSISGLTTNVALTAIKNKKTDVMTQSYQSLNLYM